MILKIDGIDEAKGFTQPQEALRYLEHERVDAALLDIDMPGMNGIDLAAAIKEKWPDTAIFFLTGYPQYALDAFRVHANGYLLKPVKKQKSEAEIRYLMGKNQRKPVTRVEARALGNFDLLVDGKRADFKRAKSKELIPGFSRGVYEQLFLGKPDGKPDRVERRKEGREIILTILLQAPTGTKKSRLEAFLLDAVCYNHDGKVGPGTIRAFSIQSSTPKTQLCLQEGNSPCGSGFTQAQSGESASPPGKNGFWPGVFSCSFSAARNSPLPCPAAGRPSSISGR